MKETNVILNPKAQCSLILFLSSFILSITSMWLLEILSKTTDFHASIILIPPLLTIIIYTTSAIFGCVSLKTSKFPLLWVVPCSIMAIALGFTTITDISRLSKLASQTVTHYESIKPGKAIGVSISKNDDTPTLVEAVFYKSPAENSGIINGDIITSIERVSVTSRNDVINILNQLEQDTIQVNVTREGKDTTIIVKR